MLTVELDVCGVWQAYNDDGMLRGSRVNVVLPHHIPTDAIVYVKG